ncbi:Coenzyme PQQ synthesis protein E [Granulibacter bethesdensis]|uniref:PqqA peptide cyclase n=1 Tax=Granulibacter bethesdensis TaxID=364410 RepID=A0AAC9KBA6_9PROT|nr:pyrroloquinoline quinone biosynthesis protein PqqE [Granulibacter bethesdensis]APH55242.1 Coenzyme PQQ synthesis protein E [Granulibacter bethesdensis]APH62829.1 Coenzyme PQQ synthesis protein E [Granulibacter bethesdensis]
MSTIEPPMGLLAELTHRCPLQCPYCSNPLELERAGIELKTEEWLRIMDEAAELGVLQMHFSGGEPMVRKDLPELIARAVERQMYTNIITSGVLLDEAMMERLMKAGIDHIQLSFQDVDVENAERIGGLAGAQSKKLKAARLIKEAGLPLTLNYVIHRQNMENLPRMLEAAQAMGATRTEIANVQYYGWGLVNRDALLPSREQLEIATATVEEARERLKGVMVIDYVTPDYYAKRPKACMGGWARRFINISPSGKALPCHAAETLTGLEFPSVREWSLADIWSGAPAFQKYRGTDWMPEPCRSCDRREIDWGGCRCQAFALTGDMDITDPACALSPAHHVMEEAVAARGNVAPDYVYRRIGNAPVPNEVLSPVAE